MNKISKLYTNWEKDNDTSLEEIEELSIMILAGNTSQVPHKKIRKLVVCLRQEIHYRDAIIESYKQSEQFAENPSPLPNKKKNKKEKTEKEAAIDKWIELSDAPKSLHQTIRENFDRWKWDTEKILKDCDRIIAAKQEKINNKSGCCDYEYLNIRRIL